jgi:hypothetical protein
MDMKDFKPGQRIVCKVGLASAKGTVARTFDKEGNEEFVVQFDSGRFGHLTSVNCNYFHELVETLN